MVDILYKKESYEIIGACLEVHKELGNGFLEAVYQDALEIEFQNRNIPYCREKQLTILYKGKPLDKTYSPDFICYDKIIVETKALSELMSWHEAQTMNYLKSTGYKLGILVNFGESSLRYKRLAY
jgi:GxxExxY protein